ncbi:precorrin-6y C5,15-methyltransferase (decarboxylating) subunit CbiE [Gordonia sp. (in: high G+C Gram-positive bacteria)]|uniref:precorrin-6y C5,15-methyltransferase (decarboxylating) subunit CbiE n=1 Tax=Gordonia sp. (in: high G+C Gram-positive bacteria) TaxID=84139 RepID=UPI003C780EF8
MSQTTSPATPPPITVVGVGADGWSGMPAEQQKLVLDASVVIGGARHLSMLPDRPDQRRHVWPSPLREQLGAFLGEVAGGSVVALASGDPLVSGIGSTLIDVLGADRVRVIPAVSSVALARAELGWSAESCVVVSLVGRDVSLVVRELSAGRRVVVLSSDENTPAAVADLLRNLGYGASVMHVLGDLGSADFSRRDGTVATWTGPSPRLNVIGLELSGPPHGSWVAGLPDSVFENDGQLTKRDLRASALARLAPVPGEHLWDVGAGAGSVGIEWMRAHPTCTTTAVEAHPDRAERIARNASNLGVPGLRVVVGKAPEALDGLPEPSAIFIGGGATAPGVVDHCLAALPAGGRLVVHGVTIETERLLGELHAAHDGELTRLAVEVAAPIGSFTGWTPMRTVTQWTFTRGA